MKTYEITKASKGYLIRDAHDKHGYAISELYAFSTLREVQNYLPTIFEPKPIKQSPTPKVKP